MAAWRVVPIVLEEVCETPAGRALRNASVVVRKSGGKASTVVCNGRAEVLGSSVRSALQSARGVSLSNGGVSAGIVLCMF